jgi:hypothetical protein
MSQSENEVEENEEIKTVKSLYYHPNTKRGELKEAMVSIHFGTWVLREGPLPCLFYRVFLDTT